MRSPKKTAEFEGKKLVIFSQNIPWPKKLFDLLDSWKVKVLLVATSQVYEQVKALLPDNRHFMTFRLIRSPHCEILRQDILHFQPDYLFACQFYRKIPQAIVKCARIFAFNMHPSLLPKYKGSTPFTKHIENGDTHAGVSFHLLTDQFDFGDILYQFEVSLLEYENENSWAANLNNLYFKSIISFFQLLDAGKLQRLPNPPHEQTAWRRRYQEFWFDPRESRVNLSRLLAARTSSFGLRVHAARGHDFNIFEILPFSGTAQFAQQLNDQLKVGELMFLPQSSVLRVGDGLVEISVVQHGLFGIMSMAKFRQIEKIVPGDLIMLEYPGVIEKYKPYADLVSAAFYADSDFKYKL